MIETLLFPILHYLKILVMKEGEWIVIREKTNFQLKEALFVVKFYLMYYGKLLISSATRIPESIALGIQP